MDPRPHTEAEVAALPEDRGERHAFDQRANQCGSPLMAVHSMLTATSLNAPQDGSFAKYLIVMANEVAKAERERLASAAAVEAAVREAIERCRAAAWSVVETYLKRGDALSQTMAAGAIMAETAIRALAAPTPALDACAMADKEEG